jgi:hypothetical protein
MGDGDIYRMPLWVERNPLKEEMYFISDAVIVDFESNEERLNLGETVFIDVKGYRVFDGSLYDGLLLLNDTLMKSDQVGMRTYRVESAVNGSYGISSIWINDLKHVIWDRLTVKEFGASKYDPLIEESVTIFLTVVHEFDGSLFTNLDGKVFLNSSAMEWSEENRRWERDYVNSVPGLTFFNITDINDSRYGLSYSIEHSPVIIEWRSNLILSEVGLAAISILIIILSVIVPFIASKMVFSLEEFNQ